VENFEGKVAIVTGGASGVRRALCEALGRTGTLVITADLNHEGTEEVAFSIREAGGTAHAAKGDRSV